MHPHNTPVKNTGQQINAQLGLDQERTLIMGILNLTPDSFSDGGRWNTPDAAIKQAQYLLSAGADLIDVGGESTRPGSQRVPPEIEQKRILAVIRELTAAKIIVSVDTVNASTAQKALSAGAQIINDVSGGCYDPEMKKVMAQTQAPVIIQHWRGFPGTKTEKILTHNVVKTVITELKQQVETVVAAGVDPARIIIDPGLGFAKDTTGSWEIINQIQDLQSALEKPILLGASRKRMVKELASETVTVDHLTAATTVIAAQQQVWAVRVHEPAANLAAIRVAKRLAQVSR